LIQVIEAIDPPRKASFSIENVGTCDEFDARFSDAEIDLIVRACARKSFGCHMRREKPNQALQHNAGTAPSADEVLSQRG
jgi:hypothetical protein